MSTWNRNAEAIETREEKNYSGGAIGQTGSATRQELIVCMFVLFLPVHSMYATDSVVMMAKAKKLIKTAKVNDIMKAQWGSRPTNDMFPGNRLGLQRDGDRLEQPWNAVINRGAANHDLRKAKGHATKEGVEAGTSTAADKEGNDKSDANADEGVEEIHVKGLVVLGEWIAERHGQYKKPMQRIHNMIAVSP